jgi:hypothetical protein
MATPELSVALATLLRGPLHAEDALPVWRSLTTLGPQLREHLEVLGMRLVVDDVEQYAYLQQLDELPEGMPRLARRHALTYGSTVLLILLRQRMTTAEADGETPRLIVTAAEMTEWMRLYRRDGVSEERIAGDISVLVKLGYLRRLRDSDDTYEVRRIIKALVTADWLATYRDRLIDAAAAPAAPAADEPVHSAEPVAELEEQGAPA